MYLSATESAGEDKQFILRQCPGLAVGDLGGGVTYGDELRGMIALIGKSRLLLVADDAVHDFVYPSTISTYTGALDTSTGTVRIVEGTGNVAVVVDGTNGYVLNTSTRTVTKITDTDWLGSTQVEFLDGYYIFAQPSADVFYISAIDNPSAFDALDFSSSDRIPDNIVAMRVSGQELFIFGTHSTEIWVNSGGTDFPFARYTQAPIDIGIVGKDAAVKTTDSLFFVGKSRSGQAVVYQMAGHTPRRVSTRAVEEALLSQDGVDQSTIRMWTYQTAGAEFVGIECEGMDSTWVYDIASGQWHERGTEGASFSGSALSGYQRLFILDMGTLNGVHYVGIEDGTAGDWYIGKVDDTKRLWGAGVMSRERTWPHLISPSFEPVKYASLELMCTTGDLDPSSATGSVTLEISNDGGNTWGSTISRSLGASADYTKRVRWFPLGQAHDRVFRIRCDDEVDFNIHGAQVEASL